METASHGVPHNVGKPCGDLGIGAHAVDHTRNPRTRCRGSRPSGVTASWMGPAEHSQSWAWGGIAGAPVDRTGCASKQELRRSQFSWTRIKGESDVEGGRGHGSVEEGEGSGVGADGGSPEGDRSQRRRRGGWVGGLGTRPAVVREPENGTWFCGCCAASRWTQSRVKSG